MKSKGNWITISQRSTLARALESASSGGPPLCIEGGGVLYELLVNRRALAPPTEDETARSIAGMRAAAGSWKDVDIDAFKAYLRERRTVGSRPPAEL